MDATATAVPVAEGEQAYTCEVCGKTFTDQHAYGGHRSSAHREQVESQCPECGQTFGSWQALGTHRYRKHGVRREGKTHAKTKQRPKLKADDVVANALRAQVEQDKREHIGKLREQLASAERLVTAAEQELHEARELRNYVAGELRKLDPAATKPTSRVSDGNEARARVQHARRVDALRSYIDTHPDALVDGFTATRLVELVKEAGGMAMTTETGARALQELHDSGVVRADKVVRGGGMQYKLVGSTNGSEPDAT